MTEPSPLVKAIKESSMKTRLAITIGVIFLLIWSCSSSPSRPGAQLTQDGVDVYTYDRCAYEANKYGYGQRNQLLMTQCLEMARRYK